MISINFLELSIQIFIIVSLGMTFLCVLSRFEKSNKIRRSTEEKLDMIKKVQISELQCKLLRTGFYKLRKNHKYDFSTFLEENFIFTEDNWNAVYDQYNLIYDNELVMFQKIFKITPADCKILILSKLGINSKEIFSILDYAPQSYYSRRAILKKKFHLPEDVDLDHFIRTWKAN